MKLQIKNNNITVLILYLCKLNEADFAHILNKLVWFWRNVDQIAFILNFHARKFILRSNQPEVDRYTQFMIVQCVASSNGWRKKNKNKIIKIARFIPFDAWALCDQLNVL